MEHTDITTGIYEEEETPENERDKNESTLINPNNAISQTPYSETVPTESSLTQTLKAGLKGGFTFQLLITIFSCAIGSNFQVAFNNGCLNTPADFIKKWQNDSFHSLHGTHSPEEYIWSVTVSMLSLGAIFGCAFVSYLANKFGRKRSLLYNNLLVAVHCILMEIAYRTNNYIIMIVARFIIGINSGINSSLGSMYLDECSPINHRASIGCLAELFGYSGLFIAQVVGLPFFLGNENDWNWIFHFPLIPMAVQLTLMGFFCPESPNYNFIIRGRIAQAERDLKLLRGKDDIADEFDLLDQEAGVNDSNRKRTLKAILENRTLRWSLLLGIFIMFSVQFSGIAASEIIIIGAKIATCGLGFINMPMMLLSMYLVECPRIGRRPIYIVSCAGCCVFSALIAITILASGKPEEGGSNHVGPGPYLSVVCVFFFSILYAIGMGSISMVYVNEFFPSEARATGNGVTIIVMLMFRMIILISFPKLNKEMGGLVFFIFAISMLFSTIFGFMALPETKNKVQERIQRDIKRKRKRLTKFCCNYR